MSNKCKNFFFSFAGFIFFCFPFLFFSIMDSTLTYLCPSDITYLDNIGGALPVNEYICRILSSFPICFHLFISHLDSTCCLREPTQW